MKFFIMLSWPLSAVLAADIHMEVRLLRREQDGRLDVDSQAAAERSRVAMQISSAADAKSLEAGHAGDVGGFVNLEGLNSDVLAKVFDTEHNVIDGLACPNSGTALNYEPDCKFLRDNSPFGFSLTQSDISYNARYASMTRAVTFIGRLPPNDVYYSWVLPYRIMHEKPEQWRYPLNLALSSLVSGLADTVTAVQTVIPQIWALRTNATFMALLNLANVANPSESLVFVNGSDSLQPFADTIARGTASSLGLSIYAVAALRSIGIPARVVGVNHWGTRAEGNYYWVEFWTCRANDGTDVWSFFDADPGAAVPPINSAWFLPAFTRWAQKGNQTGIYTGTFDRALPDGLWNVSMQGNRTAIIVPSIDRTDFYHSFDPVTTTTTLSTIVNMTQFCIDGNISDCSTTTTTTTLYMCGTVATTQAAR